MRTMMTVCAWLILGATGAGAAEIQGKWGIGAGVFGGGGEVSLIRGRSERSAWIFDVGINQRYDESALTLVPPAPGPGAPLDVRRSFSIAAGPGYRRFLRPSEPLSPYWDVRVRGRYARYSQNGYALELLRTDRGVDAGLAFGLEYFTPWHFSVAAHSTLASIAWTRSADTRDIFAGTKLHSVNDGESLSLGLAPVIFVRGYF